MLSARLSVFVMLAAGCGSSVTHDKSLLVPAVLSAGLQAPVPEAFGGSAGTERLRTLSEPVPWGGQPVVPYTLALDRESARSAALVARASRRAFDGAPPVMPHSATFGAGIQTCLDCHTDGMRIGERVAHPMSHPPLTACTQCHVEAVQRELPTKTPIESTFAGFRPVQRAADGLAGRPPVTPHSIYMRTRCLACHGKHGYDGLRTSHPGRALCVQCHVQSSAQFGGVR